MTEPQTLDVVIGHNIARYRQGVGLTQDELARRLSAIGFDLSQRKMARTEAGERPIPLSEIALFAAAFKTSLEALLAGDGDVELVEDFIVSMAAVRAALRGEGDLLKSEAAGGLHAAMRRKAPAAESGVGDAERWAARRLAVPLEELVAAARRLWGQTLTEKRDALLAVEAGAQAGTAPSELRELRRAVTRQLLMPELAQELGVDLSKKEGE